MIDYPHKFTDGKNRYGHNDGHVNKLVEISSNVELGQNLVLDSLFTVLPRCIVGSIAGRISYLRDTRARRYDQLKVYLDNTVNRLRLDHSKSVTCTNPKNGIHISDPNSCVGRCNEAFNSGDPCHCNTLCNSFGNCCSDYHGEARCSNAPSSCVNRCGEAYDNRDTCHCDNACSGAGNCCSDYNHICTGDDLSRLANEMWYGDWNTAIVGSDVQINKQEYISDRKAYEDLSPNDFISYFDADILNRKTFSQFVSLLDNYYPHTGQSEDITSEELLEEDIFLDEIMTTYPMRKAHEYLVDKGLASPDEKTFKDDLKKIWFEMYTRSSGPIDSSGFEHVFVGEFKNGAVTGFHNWVQFYFEELDKTADYYGWISDVQPDIMGVQFDWDSFMKEITSMWIGRSPEFEMGIFTVCFKERPNSQCSFTLAGTSTRVQTWDEKGTWVGTAYPIA
ncbi:uridylate-specific endoribonuclease B-like [Glandiceps talaboti]